MTKRKTYEHLIVTKPVPVTELPHHEFHTELPLPVIMSQDLVPEANVWALYFFVKDITPEQVEQITNIGRAVPHTHDCDEMYLMIGDKGAITFEVILGEEVYEVETPACVYLPKGVPHGIRAVKATVGLSGGAVPTLFKGAYKTLPADTKLG